MPIKKGSKRKAKAKKDEALRLELLRSAEAEAEIFQQKEDDRRDLQETEERCNFIKDAQAQLLQEKDHTISVLSSKQNELLSLFSEKQFIYESNIQELSNLRDALINEISLLKYEASEKENLIKKERQLAVESHRNLKEEQIELKKSLSEKEKSHRKEVHDYIIKLENIQKTTSELIRVKEEAQKQINIKTEGCEKALERALVINKSLQEAIESRESDDQKNLALMQLLTVQLDEATRRFNNQLIEEKHRLSRANEEIVRYQAQTTELNDIINNLKLKEESYKHNSKLQLHEYKNKLSQLEFDAQYLTLELEFLRDQYRAVQYEAKELKTQTELNNKTYALEIESLERMTRDLEELLKQKELEHYDRTTFLNAQIFNNRSIIQKLQNTLETERQNHADGQALLQSESTQATTELIICRENAERQQIKESYAQEQLLNDVAILKSTVFHQQLALQEMDRNMIELSESKDQEIKRLEQILDANFIPHRQGAELAEGKQATTVDELRQKLALVMQTAEEKEQLALEQETFLKARIANQNNIIESLQKEIQDVQSSRDEDVRCLENELSRLRKTLAVYFVPYNST